MIKRVEQLCSEFDERVNAVGVGWARAEFAKRLAELEGENERLSQLTTWENEDDQPIPEDAEIDAAHPLKSRRHDLYQEAMRLVGAKRSKYGLVSLVNWLLLECAKRQEALSADGGEGE